MKITFLNRQFSFSLPALGLYLLLLALLCSLGFWQLSRAEQKKLFLQKQQAATEAVELDLNQQPVTDVDAVRYQKALVTGHYDQAHQFLVDNQIVDGKPGYFVLTPFLLDQTHKAVLVNRGWLPLGQDRKVLPNIGFDQPVQQVNGRLNHFPPVGIKLKGAEIPSDGWPAVVQVVDSTVLAGRLGYGLYDYQIELDAAAPQGYRREWKINTLITPEKHLGYAVQWFGLALTLTGLFFWMSSRKSSEHTV